MRVSGRSSRKRANSWRAIRMYFSRVPHKLLEVELDDAVEGSSGASSRTRKDREWTHRTVARPPERLRISISP